MCKIYRQNLGNCRKSLRFGWNFNNSFFTETCACNTQETAHQDVIENSTELPVVRHKTCSAKAIEMATDNMSREGSLGMKRYAVYLSALLGAAVASQAVPVKLDVAPYITPDTTVPGNPPNQGVSTVQAWLQDLVNAYNAINDPDLPAVAPNPAVDVWMTQRDVTSLVISVSGYTYLTVHWGGPQKASGNDHSQAWYLGGNLDSFTLTAPVFVNRKGEAKQYGLSGYRLWNPVRVPDGGSTLALLGVGLLALAGYARNRHPHRTPTGGC